MSKANQNLNRLLEQVAQARFTLCVSLDARCFAAYHRLRSPLSSTLNGS
ncbi:hypothetical protein [Methylotuvimicrobium sp. KM1]